jgi:glutamate racemase
LLKPLISAKIGRRVTLVDSAEEVVRELGVGNWELGTRDSEERDKLYFSDLTEQVRNIVKRWLGEEIELQEADWGE